MRRITSKVEICTNELGGSVFDTVWFDGLAHDFCIQCPRPHVQRPVVSWGVFFEQAAMWFHGRLVSFYTPNIWQAPCEYHVRFTLPSIWFTVTLSNVLSCFLMMSKKQIELFHTTSNHIDSPDEVMFPNHMMVTSKKKLKSGGYVRMTPFPGCQWPQGSYRRGKVIFHLYDEWIQKKTFCCKKPSCGLGFRHCIVIRICIPTPGFVGIGGSMPAWPSNRASQNRQGPPAWPTQFVTSRYKVKVSHARSPKRPQLGSSTATMSQPKRFWRNT